MHFHRSDVSHSYAQSSHTVVYAIQGTAPALQSVFHAADVRIQ